MVSRTETEIFEGIGKSLPGDDIFRFSSRDLSQPLLKQQDFPQSHDSFLGDKESSPGLFHEECQGTVNP